MSQTRLPHIAVFIPTKNDEQFIGTTLLALFDEIIRYLQEGGRAWVGIANDGSTDETARVVQAFLPRCPVPYEFINRKVNLGVTATLSELAGIAPAESDTFLRCDADARFLCSDWLAYMAKFLISDPLVGVVAPMMIFPDGTIDCHGVQYFPGGREFIGHNQYLAETASPLIAEVDTVLGAYSMVRRVDWSIDTGYFLWIEDEDQGLTVRRNGKKCFSLSAIPLVHYNRIRAARVSDNESSLANEQSRWNKALKGTRLLAASVLPSVLRRGINSAIRRPSRAEQVMAQSKSHFESRWGFFPESPNLTLLRNRFAGTQLLWFEDETSQSAGHDVITRFLSSVKFPAPKHVDLPSMVT